jgi:hypothetical protein
MNLYEHKNKESKNAEQTDDVAGGAIHFYNHVSVTPFHGFTSIIN